MQKHLIKKVAMFYIFLQVGLISGLVEDNWILVSASLICCIVVLIELYRKENPET